MEKSNTKPSTLINRLENNRKLIENSLNNMKEEHKNSFDEALQNLRDNPEFHLRWVSTQEKNGPKRKERKTNILREASKISKRKKSRKPRVFGKNSKKRRGKSVPRNFSRKFLSQSKRQSRKAIRDISIIEGMDTVSVSSYSLSSLEGIGTRSQMKGLYIQNNYLVSFKHLGIQPQMTELNISNNKICSFLGLETQPKLRKIFLRGNPITNHPYYRLMCIMCVGKSLKYIDNEQVSVKEREFCQLYNRSYPLAVDALRNGWLFDLNVKAKKEFKLIFNQLNKLDLDKITVLKHTEGYKELFEENNRLKRKQENKKKNQEQSNKIKAKNTKKIDNRESKLLEEINLLKKEIIRLKENSVFFEDLMMFDSFSVKGLSIVKENSYHPVVVVLYQNFLKIINEKNEEIFQIVFSIIGKTSLIVDYATIYRFQIQYNEKGIINLITSKRKLATTLYKLIHIKIQSIGKNNYRSEIEKKFSKIKDEKKKIVKEIVERGKNHFEKREKNNQEIKRKINKFSLHENNDKKKDTENNNTKFLKILGNQTENERKITPLEKVVNKKPQEDIKRKEGKKVKIKHENDNEQKPTDGQDSIDFKNFSEIYEPKQVTNIKVEKNISKKEINKKSESKKEKIVFDEKNKKEKKFEETPKKGSKDYIGTVNGKKSTFRFFEKFILVNQTKIEYRDITGLDKYEEGKNENDMQVVYEIEIDENFQRQKWIIKEMDAFESELIGHIENEEN